MTRAAQRIGAVQLAVRDARSRAESSPGSTQLEDLTKDVLSGDLETARAAVANQLINTRLRAIELGRKIREAEELEARLEALEEALGHERGSRSWGA